MLLAAPPAFAQEPFELQPGVLVDPGRQAVYLMAPEGRVDALDAATGATRWSSTAAAKPLLVVGSRVLAQAETEQPGRLPIVALDVGRGEVAFRSDIPLPSDVRAQIDQRPGARFEVRAHSVGPSVVVSWTLTKLPGRDGSPARVRSGAARVLAASGAVQRGAAEPQASEAVLPGPVAQLVGSGALPHTPWRVDSTLAIAVRAGNSRDRLVLRRWDASGAEQSPVVLLEGGYVSHLPSGDRRYVVATTREPGANVSTPYHWSVFELASGRKLTDFWSRDSAGPFAVAGPNLLRTVQPLARSGSTGLVEEPLQVRAQDLATGGTIWTRPVRDVMDRYRGIPRSGS